MCSGGCSVSLQAVTCMKYPLLREPFVATTTYIQHVPIRWLKLIVSFSSLKIILEKSFTFSNYVQSMYSFMYVQLHTHHSKQRLITHVMPYNAVRTTS